ncbi:SUKH-4 family immunity protein [Streptomyces sp. bgisy022]|uniref:SUKH-4 family immunity protein n=1 Tax=Streptomyces sp. bgisy022 TaxID=3413769 RepID=UPI003D7385B9
MIFEVSQEELSRIFGAEHLHRVPGRTAQEAGFSGEALAHLTEVGLPDNPFISFPTLDGAPHPEFRPVVSEETSACWELPTGTAHWVFLGNFEISAIAADTRTGEIFQFTEGIMRPIPLHGDLSSLVHTIMELTKVAAILHEHDGDDDDEFLDALGNNLDAARCRISLRDPRPFADERSEWVDIAIHIGAGSWGPG